MSTAGLAAPEVDTAWPADAVEIGRIIGAWGVKGWIKVQPYSGHPAALFHSRLWFLSAPEPAASRQAPRGGQGNSGAARRFLKRPREAAGAPGAEPVAPGAGFVSLLQVSQAREHNDMVVACARQVTDRAAAQALHGARVFVSRSSFPPTGADEYYWVDLIGLIVVNREGQFLGTVSGLIDTGPHSVLRVANADASAQATEESERLIPFVAPYVDEVSLQDRRITVDWGLDY